MNLLRFLQELLCPDLIKERNELSLDNFGLQGMVSSRDRTIESLKQEIISNKQIHAEEIKQHKSQLMAAQDAVEDRILEYFWNNHIKSTDKLYYAARNSRNMNVIRFFNEHNDTVPTVEGINNDFKANNALKHVAKNITYTSDAKENWQWADETVERKLGDCEDGAILMANIMIKSGIPYWRIRLNAGDVKGGGHAYVTYLRETDNTWYILDWCYWYNESEKIKKTWKTASKYFGIWFSWNTRYGFQKDELDR